MDAAHILLVDDEERFVLNTAKLLNNRRFITSTAPSGSQALKKLSADERIAVVVLDVWMPGMDGLETLKQIKRQFPETQVIMLTGHATLEDAVRALRKGAFDYIQKPCDIDELEAKIRMALSVEHIRRHPILWPRSMAGEIIVSGFIPLLPNDSLQRALSIFNHYRAGEGARVLFVADEHRHIQGMLERSRLLNAAAKRTDGENISWEWLCSHPECLPDLPVSGIMNHEVATVTAHTALAETARLMLQHHYDSMPVIAENKMQGIVRLQDVLRYLRVADAAP